MGGVALAVPTQLNTGCASELSRVPVLGGRGGGGFRGQGSGSGSGVTWDLVQQAVPLLGAVALAGVWAWGGTGVTPLLGVVTAAAAHLQPSDIIAGAPIGPGHPAACEGRGHG